MVYLYDILRGRQYLELRREARPLLTDMHIKIMGLDDHLERISKKKRRPQIPKEL